MLHIETVQSLDAPELALYRTQKTVTVTANTEPKETLLRIKAFVTPGTGTPDAGGAQTIQVGP